MSSHQIISSLFRYFHFNQRPVGLKVPYFCAEATLTTNEWILSQGCQQLMLPSNLQECKKKNKTKKTPLPGNENLGETLQYGYKMNQTFLILTEVVSHCGAADLGVHTGTLELHRVPWPRPESRDPSLHTRGHQAAGGGTWVGPTGGKQTGSWTGSSA